MEKFNVILFNNFETLDVFGPVEIIGRLDSHYSIEFYSENGGIISSRQNVRVETLPFSDIEDSDILLIPGGQGTRIEIKNKYFIERLKNLSLSSKYVLSVCTGSALLAKTGLLKGISATSNKIAFDWVTMQDKQLNWLKKARWVRDGKYYTSSGVSAGMDMTLGFVSDKFGIETAEKISMEIEYIWNRDKDNDVFCKEVK